RVTTEHTENTEEEKAEECRRARRVSISFPFDFSVFSSSVFSVCSVVKKMRILHTGDWHLGDRIGPRGVDRTDDLRRNVERIAKYCDEEQIDVLLVAGDLFSDKLDRQRDIGDTVKHLSDTFAPFLRRGGTIVALTG